MKGKILENRYVFAESKDQKEIRGPDFNTSFNKQNGMTFTWGETPEDDPQLSPVGPLLADIEISTICHGGPGCVYCYKKNTGKGKNMSLEDFKTVFHKLGPQLQQVAFGIGDVAECPELWDIMRYCRENGQNYVVPNITINGFRITDEHIEKLVELVGACAVSNYTKDACYGTVKKLTDAGLEQVNIHQVLSMESLDTCWELLHDMQKDPRLEKLNAAVFLLLKPKGRGVNYTQLKNASLYKDFVSYALEHNLRIGFDSCSANSFINSVSDHSNFNQLVQMAEPCESSLFSIYIDVNSLVWPCSFSVGEEGIEPVNMLEVDNFMDEVWSDGPLCKFRGKLLCQNRCCPIFDVEIDQ